MAQSRLRGFAALAAKALISAALIGFALRGVDPDVVLEHMKRISPFAIALALAAFVPLALSHARRWELVLARMEHAIAYREALRLVLVGYFFNQTLPSTMGGDAYKAWGAYKHGIHAGNAVASVVVDRALGLVALVAMIAAGTWWLFDIVSSPTARLAVVGICVAGVAGFAVLVALPRFASLLGRWRATRVVLKVAEGTRAVLRSPATTAEMAALALAGHAVPACVVWVLARGMASSLSIGEALLLVPLVSLVAILPVSVAGWGLRESSMVVALGLIGVSSAEAFSLSVIFGLVVMASGIPGGFLWLAARRRRTAA